jgi:hypothetical protein
MSESPRSLKSNLLDARDRLGETIIEIETDIRFRACESDKPDFR